jgi:glycosyltransferase involved in cell wall biosynthesis
MTNNTEALADGAPLAGALRIGVNLFSLASHGGGMRQYVLQVLPWLLRLSPCRLLLFYHWQGQPSLAAMLRRLPAALRNRIRTVLVENQNNIFGHADDFDVLFCPLCALAPDLLDRPIVATIPDIQERFFPQYFTTDQLAARAYCYPYTSHAVTTLLTLSEFSKRTMCEAFGVAPARVRAIHLAPSDDIVGVRPDWPAQLGPLPERYVFYPANLYPHKNHKTLLEALRILNTERGIDCACLLTGRAVEPGTDIHAETAARGLGEKVRWLGHVSGSTLRYLYEHAVAVCFPSEFEGFGMPLAEAMLCGCPVVATPAASIPEIVGDAALLVECTPQAFADAVARLLIDPAGRRDLIARGRDHARRFDVRRLAGETLQALEEAAASFEQERAAPRTQPVSFVVRPTGGGPALAETLARLSFEVEDHDEVLLLAAAEAMGAEVRTLCENMGVVRFLPPGRRSDAWLDEVHNEYLYYLREGDWPSEGATRTALAAFAERPECQAVVGQALRRDVADHLAEVCYLPPRAWRLDGEPAPAPSTVSWWRRFGLGQEGEPPAAAVFWRAPHLRIYRRLLGGPSWPAEALARAGQRTSIRYRTFVSVAAEMPHVSAAAPPTGAAAQPPAWRRVVARPLVRLRTPGRAVARRLPAWLRQPLRGLYRRMVGS